MKSCAFMFIGLLLFVACNDKVPLDEGADKPSAEVTITHAVRGSIKEQISFEGTTVYLKKSVVTAPISSFISFASVRPGMRVHAGQLLYKLESKEHHVLGSDVNGGIISVKAPSGGIILDVQQQSGGYVVEGSDLCSIVETNSLAFLINVPYEQNGYAVKGKHCIIELPDGTKLTAAVESPLATIDSASQTEQVMAKAKAPFLPENMSVKALFPVDCNSKTRNLILPKSALQSDEMLTEYWVMKLSNDSTAVKVPVGVVRSDANDVEIKSGAISTNDRVILSGGYGLEDGARVSVTKQK